jgi:A/G-specific adenine glycosylase
MARQTPNSELRTPKLKRLVSLLLSWFTRNARDLPWRRTRDPYAIWVSEIMLQQTQVKTVIPFWNRWMRELPTIEAAAKASPAKIHKLWEGLGYYTRVRNLQKAAKQIVVECRRRGNESHAKGKSKTPHVVSYKLPEKFDDVLALPGIGRYTAGAICSIAFNQPTPILDGNVIRVMTRIFGIAKNPKEKETNNLLWQIAEELVSHAKIAKDAKSKGTLRSSRPLREDNPCSHLNQSLMELGALVCTPRNPQCRICPVRKLCVAHRENRAEELPNLHRREKASARRFVAFVVERDGKFLVRQRPAGVVNAHLWEFPNVEVAAGILPAVESGVPPGGKNIRIFNPVNISLNIPGGKMPPSTAGETPAATMLALAATDLGLEIRNARHLATVRHSITRYRITLEAYRVQFLKSPHPQAGIWKSPAQMRRFAFTAAHKKLASLAASRILSGR